MIIDNFLDHWEAFRDYCDKAEYADHVSEFDGVTYPGVCTDIPEGVAAEATYKAQQLIGKPILSATQFLRLTLCGVDIIHRAHTDAIMADYLMIVYMNRPELCQGGLELVRHSETGLQSHPTNDTELGILERDCNDELAWDVIERAEMTSNRAVIIEADRMHRAASPYAYGKTPMEGRLVFISMFRVMK